MRLRRGLAGQDGVLPYLPRGVQASSPRAGDARRTAKRGTGAAFFSNDTRYPGRFSDGSLGQAHVKTLSAMGFEEDAARQCLSVAFNDVELAAQYCMEGIPANVARRA